MSNFNFTNVKLLIFPECFIFFKCVQFFVSSTKLLWCQPARQCSQQSLEDLRVGVSCPKPDRFVSGGVGCWVGVG